MGPQIVSRSQRRIERRQAMLLLALVLAVSLVSFALGVMVGRGQAPTPVAAGAGAERLPVIRPGASAAAPPGPGVAQDLTFYDSLPKGGKPPMGSGINLPPAEKTFPSAAPVAVQPTSPPAQPASPVPIQGDAAANPSAAVRAAPPPAASAKAPTGAWLIQVASFRDVEDARKLQQRLGGKGYAVSIQEANLREKGVWHRVVVGPFDNEGAATGAAGRLQDEEKLPVMIRKP